MVLFQLPRVFTRGLSLDSTRSRQTPIPVTVGLWNSIFDFDLLYLVPTPNIPHFCIHMPKQVHLRIFLNSNCKLIKIYYVYVHVFRACLWVRKLTPKTFKI